MEFFVQIALILACLFYGARKGGVALGLLGGLTIRSTLAGVLMIGIFSWFRGKDLAKDEVFRAALVPVALSIGVPPGYVVAFAAACYANYILPTYPSDLAIIQFDRSGTTRIGK